MKKYDLSVAFLLWLWCMLYSYVVGVVEKPLWDQFLNFPDWVLMIGL